MKTNSDTSPHPIQPITPVSSNHLNQHNYAGTVTALDANKKLLDTALELGKAGNVELVIPSPSAGGSSVTQRVSLGHEANPERIAFKQCDPMCLPAGMAGEEGRDRLGLDGMFCCMRERAKVYLDRIMLVGVGWDR